MAFSTLVLVSLFALLPLISAFNPNSYAVTCNSNAYWALFPLNASIVDPVVPADYSFIPTSSLPAAFSSLPSDHRIFNLEFNRPIDCAPTGLPLIKTTMNEFKVQIPYLKSKKFNNAAPLMLKPIIYVDNLINAIAGSATYGLNTVFTDKMIADFQSNLYTLQYSGGFISGIFTPRSDWMPIASLPANSPFAPFISMHDNAEWLGHDVFQRTRCGKNYNLWTEGKIRFVDAAIHFDAGMIKGNTPAFSTNIVANSDRSFATAVQIQISYHITGLEKCTNN